MGISMVQTIQKGNETKILVVLLASILMDFLGFGIVLPLLPFYAQSLDASPLAISILLGLFPMMLTFAPTLWGSLSDRIGRRPAFLFNIAGTTLSFLWLSFANTLWMLFMARILGGLSSASMVIAQAYVSDLTTSEERTKKLGFLGAAAGIGFVIGPVIAGLLIGGDSTSPNFRLPALAATIASGVTFCAAFGALPEVKPIRFKPAVQHRHPLAQLLPELKQVLQRPLVGMLITLTFITFFGGIGIQAIFALWCEWRFGWGAQEFGYLLIFYCLTIAIIQLSLLGRLTRWVGEIKLLLWSSAMAALGLVLIPFANNVPQLLAALLLTIFAQALGNPVLASLLSQLAGAKQQGKTLGLMQSVIGLATFLGSVWAGFLFGSLGENWPYWTGSALIAVAVILCWQQVTHSRFSAIMRRRRQQKLIHLFELLDLDNSGTIELKDFRQAGQALAKLRGWSPGTSEYEVLQASLVGFGEMLQQLADRDGNQCIDRAEWLHWLEKEVDYDFADLFLQVIDTNQDGRVAIDELRTFYQAYGIRTEALEEAFHTLDLNQDGHLCQEEFETIFAQFLYSDDVQAPGNWIFGVSLPQRL
ncbi:MFS transporter [Leptothoe sp. LEGE 181152]|nr:MFS transporter [Leptothoe sp. LEGE 181152]